MPHPLGHVSIVIPVGAGVGILHQRHPGAGRDLSRRSPKGEVGSRHCAEHNQISCTGATLLHQDVTRHLRAFHFNRPTRASQKHNNVCNYMLKDNPLASHELNRAAALTFFFQKSDG